MVSSKGHRRIEEDVEDRGEVCLAEEVERLRKIGLSDGEIADRLGVDLGWVETLISPEKDEAAET